ncbi:hypothetical protein BH10ACT7_BH10ACT7_07910 [soil metagenome]
MGAVAFATSLVLAVGSPVDPVSAAEHARLDLAARTVAEALAASQDADRTPLVVATEPEPTPVAEGTIEPGEPSKVQVDEAAATVDFSGFEVGEQLDVTVSTLSDAAVSSAETELGATVVSTPFDIDAQTASGADVTSFPADAVIEKVENGPDIVTEVTPGVALEIAVEETDLEGLDPSSLRIVTRESEGEPWVEIPSYFDAESGTVKGEIDHLSQFVVIGTKFVPPPGPRIVLDPDDDVGHTVGPGGPMTELPQNVRLANELAARLTEGCLAEVMVTRTSASPAYLSSSTRAGMAASHSPNLTITLAFDALTGFPWGTDSDGGSKVYARGGGADAALAASLAAQLPGYTGRPARGVSSSSYPYSAFDGLPGAMVHLETLFIDHNYDRPVIDNGFDFIVSGVFTGLGVYLESQGFDCTDPVTGGWPARPSEAQLAQWRNLGYQNYLTYGADPVSFSTGNLLEDELIFSLPGVGGQSLDLTLIYNSLDGRLGRAGAGWNFGLTAHAQKFDDGSALVVRGDGASFMFEPDGTGGYVGEDGLYLTLTPAEDEKLLLTAADGESWLFDTSDIEGIGELAVHTDRQGNAYTLGYGEPDEDIHQFVPLTSITDAAGQVVAVGSDELGRITTFTHPDGRLWSLAYTEAGDLSTITQPDGRTRTFTYDDAHRMLTATDTAGIEYLVNEYDTEGRVIKQWDAENNLRTFDYQVEAGEGGQTVYTDNEGNESVFAFDEKSRITSITDALGQTQSYTYDDRNQVTSFTDERGETWQYTYDDNGNLATETDPTGATAAYTYTPTGEIASVTDALGRSTTFSVDARGLTTGITRADGVQLTNEYSATGDLTLSTDAAGGVTTFGYDARGNLASMTDQLGRTTTFAYDLANRLTSVTDPAGGTTTFVWDTSDRLVTQTDAAGGATSFTYDGNDHPVTRTDPDGAITTYVWDDLFRVVKVTDPVGGVTEFEYNTEDDLTATTDPLGNQTTFDLDALYRPVSVTDATGGEWSRTYDPVGNLLSSVDPLGATTSDAYDEVGRLTTTTDALGAVSTTEFDALGRMVTETDALGQSISYEYDVLDRLVTVTDQAGETTSYGYDARGNLIEQVDRRGSTTEYSYDAASQLTSWAGPLGTGGSYTYDSRGNTIASTDALGRTSVLAYDALSRPIAAADPLGNTSTVAYDGMGRVTASMDPNGNVTTLDYDLAGRLTASIDPLGNTTSQAWDAAGRRTSMTEPNGVTTAYAYDALGRLTSVTEGATPLPAPAASDVNVTTTYAYTAVGNVSRITDPVGAVTQFVYDALGRTTQETNPLGKTWQYEYDALGRQTKEVDAKNQTTTYAYTPRSDLAKIDHPTEVDTTFTYDAGQNLIVMTDALGASGWVLDAAGRMTKQTDSLGKVLQYTYDTTGAQTGLKLPGGDTVTYEYDNAGRPVLQESRWGDLAYGYDAASNLTDVLRSTGVTTSYGYDAGNRVTDITHTSPGAELGCDLRANDLEVGAEASIADLIGLDLCVTVDIDLPVLTGLDYGDKIDLDYTYDQVGNVKSQARKDGSAPKVTTTYGYDKLNRLTLSAGPASNTYKYDKAGNRTQWVTNKAPDTGKALTLNASYNGAGQLTVESKTRPALLGSSTVSTAYTYDANGNRTKTQTGLSSTTYKYTDDNKLAEVNQTGRKVTTGYDGLGRSLTSTTSSLLILASTTTQVWDGYDVVQQSTGSAVTNLVRDVTGDVAIQTTPGLLGSSTQWGLTDRLGSTIAQASGSRVGQLAKYSDWGIPTFASVGFNSITGYTGELSDTTAGLKHYYARSYEPTSASWLTADPYRGTMTNPGSMARYAYVEGNPTTYEDLYGYAGRNQLETRQMGGGGKTLVKGSHGGGPTTPIGNARTKPERHGPPCAFVGLCAMAQNLAAGAAAVGLTLAGAVAGRIGGAAAGAAAILSNPLCRVAIVACGIGAAHAAVIGSVVGSVVGASLGSSAGVLVQSALDSKRTGSVSEILGLWLIGQAPAQQTYGAGSGLVDDLRQATIVKDARADVLSQIRQGQSTWTSPVIYDSGGAAASNFGQFLLDGCTYATWSTSACFGAGDRLKAGIGSYNMQITGTKNSDGTVTLTYSDLEGTYFNKTGLGSALGFTPELRELLDSLPVSTTIQHVYWEETVP